MIALKIVIDSYAWIEFFIGSEKGRKVKELLSRSNFAYTPDIVLAEIARKYLRENMSIETIKERLNIIMKISTIIAIDDRIAIEAAKEYMGLKEITKKEKLSDPSLIDAIVLAIAKINQAKVVTGDEHLKSLPETIWIGEEF